MFFEKGVLRIFAKFTGKHLCQGLFFNKVAGLRPATLLKKRLWHRCFPANFTKFLRTSFLTEHLRWLLLTLVIQGFLQGHIHSYFHIHFRVLSLSKAFVKFSLKSVFCLTMVGENFQISGVQVTGKCICQSKN